MSTKDAWYHILTAQNQREEKKSLCPCLGLENSCRSSLSSLGARAQPGPTKGPERLETKSQPLLCVHPRSGYSGSVYMDKRKASLLISYHKDFPNEMTAKAT